MKRIKTEVESVLRDNEIKLFLDEFPQIFKEVAPLPFDPSGQDAVKELVVDELTKIALGQKLGELILEDQYLIENQEVKEKELHGAKQLVELYTLAPQTGNAATPMEVFD